ncbi:MAG: glycosyltransferase family 39 protein [Candidatus Shapirobacteria bacterium]
MKKIKLRLINFLKRNKILFVLSLSAVLIIVGILGHSYELDEAFSIFVSRDWRRMFGILWHQEANMWFYYILLHFWQRLGTSEIIIRSLSAIFALMAAGVSYKIAEYLFDKKTAILASLLLIFNMYFIFYAQQARSYSLALFLTCLSSCSYLCYLKEGKHKLLYIFSTALAFYAHFYTLLVLAAQVFVSLLQRKFKKLIPVYFWIGFLLLPALIAPSFLSHQVDWEKRPLFASLLGTVFALSGDFILLCLVFALLFFKNYRFLFKHYRKFEVDFLGSWLIFPIILSFAFSWLFKPVYQSVYFLICLPPFAILSAIYLRNIPSHLIRKLVIILIMGLSWIRLSFWYTKNESFRSVFNNNPEDWKSLVNYVETNSTEADAVIFYGYYNHFPFELYSASSNLKLIEISSGSYAIGPRLPGPNKELISQFEYPGVWLVLRNADKSAVDYSSSLDEIMSGLSYKYQISIKTEFPELEVILYVRKD